MSRPRTYATLFDRLAACVVIDPYTHCWTWIGPTRRHGGGDRPAVSLRVPGVKHPRQHNAARVMCETIHGPLEPGHEASHLCDDNWLCVCPDHLIPETKGENLARRNERIRAAAYWHPDNDPDWRAGETCDPVQIPF